ncbi:glyceraldehyde-3-phosphate dehydrogenase [Reticulomyxa filosa]|uniref:Phosphoglycerate kinase n=1 Tax=Reticulomyxa filosa TaxID=46433 RepID=X6MXD5_RETFI|nr:glyceraldehyde-3-phosphate dehydrogenase [Reticulomyxa filosa]|eukprot:ETO18286.1 glyceraldehyde-3-phosphate dehydrogenase [Reticulomyxa filosa]
MVSGPFKYLNNTWELKQNEKGTEINFHIDFAFKSVVLEKIIGIFFNKAAEKMASAFDYYIEIGKSLKSRRQQMNISYKEVADKLKIRESYIKAIEDGETQHIPSHVYFNGYVKIYSEFLGETDFDFNLLKIPVNENLKLKPQEIINDLNFFPTKRVLIAIAINGFGRIGRCILRAWVESGRKDIEVVVVNVGFGQIDHHIHLLHYDSTHGIFNKFQKIDDNSIEINGKKIPIISEIQPEKINWSQYNIDVVLECSGAFTKREAAAKHLQSNISKVIVSAPCEGADKTIVYGVNEQVLTREDKVISIGSCTTNCLAPIAKILNDALTIESGFMTTIHSYTNDQSVLDAIHKDKRRSRACGISMIPSSTGAAKALGLVLPELAGKLDGVSVRVPTHNVSMVDLKFTSKSKTSAIEINEIIKDAAKSKIGKVLDYTHEELVSIDFNHNSKSSIFDLTQTRVVNENFCRIAACADILDKKVFLRVDLNVPIIDKQIIDATRISSILPTLEYLVANKAKVILASHFGRPNGNKVPSMSLQQLVPEIAKLSGYAIEFIDDSVGNKVEEKIMKLKEGEVLLLENLRFYKEEESNEITFSKALAKLADIYVNDAFSCSHRSHASIVGITQFIPSYAGFLMEKEISNLDLVLSNQNEATVAIIGGGKVSTKFKILDFLADRLEHLIITGAMANTFLKAMGREIGQSYYEESFVTQAKLFLNKQHKAKIYIPSDFSSLDTATNNVVISNVDSITKSLQIYDLGPESYSEIHTILKQAKVVLWNGPLGLYEDDRFTVTTYAIARLIID